MLCRVCFYASSVCSSSGAVCGCDTAFLSYSLMAGRLASIVVCLFVAAMAKADPIAHLKLQFGEIALFLYVVRFQSFG